MAKTDTGSFWGGLLEVSLYKRNQGRLARQLTAAGLGVVVLVGAYILSQGPLSAVDSKAITVGVPVAICAAAGWLIFRLVNYPLFAEFLISVEGEMNKVSWGTKDELYRATVVVLGTMLFLAVILYAYDGLWLVILRSIGVLQA
jgi:preprotein translocase subunit SecE